MKVCIFGGQQYRLTPDDIEALDEARRTIPITCVLTSNRSGVNAVIREWARRRKLPLQIYHTAKGRIAQGGAPFGHDALVVDANGLIAFPGGDDVAAVIKAAERRALDVWDWRHVDKLRPSVL